MAKMSWVRASSSVCRISDSWVLRAVREEIAWPIPLRAPFRLRGFDVACRVGEKA